MNSWVPHRQLYLAQFLIFLFLFEKAVDYSLLFLAKLEKCVFYYFVLEDGLVVSFITPVGPGKYDVFLVCSQEK